MFRLTMFVVLVVTGAGVYLSRGESSEAYTACGSPQPAGSFPVEVYLDPNGFNENLSYAEMSAALDRAWQVWVDLPDSNITFVRVATKPSYPGSVVQFTPDLHNPMPFTGESYCNDWWHQSNRQPQVMRVRSTYTAYDADPSDGIGADKAFCG